MEERSTTMKKKTNKKTFALYFNKDIHKKMKLQATREGRSLSAMLEEAFIIYKKYLNF